MEYGSPSTRPPTFCGTRKLCPGKKCELFPPADLRKIHPNRTKPYLPRTLPNGKIKFGILGPLHIHGPCNITLSLSGCADIRLNRKVDFNLPLAAHRKTLGYCYFLADDLQLYFHFILLPVYHDAQAPASDSTGTGKRLANAKKRSSGKLAVKAKNT